MTLSLFVLLTGLAAAPQAVPSHPCPVVDSTRQDAALATYDARIADYVALHKRLEGPLPPQQISITSWGTERPGPPRAEIRLVG